MPDPATAPPPETKPKRARKAKAAPAPKAPRAPRKKPETIHGWLRDQGPAHVEAARILGKQFVKDLRVEFARFDEHAAAMLKVGTLKIELALAEKALAAFGGVDQPMPHKARLDSLAKSIATARGEVPHPDDALPIEPDAPTA